MPFGYNERCSYHREPNHASPLTHPTTALRKKEEVQTSAFAATEFPLGSKKPALSKETNGGVWSKLWGDFSFFVRPRVLALQGQKRPYKKAAPWFFLGSFVRGSRKLYIQSWKKEMLEMLERQCQTLRCFFNLVLAAWINWRWSAWIFFQSHGYKGPFLETHFHQIVAKEGSSGMTSQWWPYFLHRTLYKQMSHKKNLFLLNILVG